ncbi:hypothetical protein BpHYR1_045798 [Brachionus plicatilis]|uniref:Uncharacterized protein n=1 Tax=Brachionus plicatilis TaxID=10195 RepID=A0A3M7QXG5_BRAPC|nr:hypothetical protein BpHYR1_045798 [Brachionus plicatilis]
MERKILIYCNKINIEIRIFDREKYLVKTIHLLIFHENSEQIESSEIFPIDFHVCFEISRN